MTPTSIRLDDDVKEALEAIPTKRKGGLGKLINDLLRERLVEKGRLRDDTIEFTYLVTWDRPKDGGDIRKIIYRAVAELVKNPDMADRDLEQGGYITRPANNCILIINEKDGSDIYKTLEKHLQAEGAAGSTVFVVRVSDMYPRLGAPWPMCRA